MITQFNLALKHKGILLFLAMLATASVLLLTPKTASAYGTTLYTGESLERGASLRSASEQFHLIMQSDGNLVAHMWPKPYWAAGTNSANARIQMQSDGNLVIYSTSGGVVWASNTYDPSGGRLVLQDDGNIVLVGNSRGILWSPNAVPTKLHSGQALQGNKNWAIFSPDRRYRMVMQSDGNAVLYDRNTAIWAKHGFQPNSTLDMQTDANLVLYDSQRNVKWASNKFGPNGSYLEGQNDGNFVIYGPSRQVIWSTRSDSAGRPTGTRAQLAGQILSHPNIGRSGTCVTDDLQRTSRGEATSIGSYLHPDLLANTLALAQDKKITITAITTCGQGHAKTSHHYLGRGIDLVAGPGNSLSSMAGTIYHNRGAWRVDELIHKYMPNGTHTLDGGAHFTFSTATMNAHASHVHHSVKP